MLNYVIDLNFILCQIQIKLNHKFSEYSWKHREKFQYDRTNIVKNIENIRVTRYSETDS